MPIMYYAVQDLAHDLHEGAYSQGQLAKVCALEAPRLGLHPRELNRKVEAAYQALFVFGGQ